MEIDIFTSIMEIWRNMRLNQTEDHDEVQRCEKDIKVQLSSDCQHNNEQILKMKTEL